MPARKSTSLKQRWRNAIVGYDVVAPDQLLAHPLNWRIHGPDQKAALIGSLNDLGWIAPVIVNTTTGHTIDGHERIGEAIARHEPGIPVIYVQLTEAQEALALATFDPITAMAGTDKEHLGALLQQIDQADEGLLELLETLARTADMAMPNAPDLPEDQGEVAPDVAAALQAQWHTALGQLWEIGPHRLLIGDALDPAQAARLLDGHVADLLLTDPPYNLEIAYDLTDDDRSVADYTTFTRTWFTLWREGSVRQIVTCGLNNLSLWLEWWTPFHVAPWVKANSMSHGVIAQWWCWEPILFFGESWSRQRASDVFDYPVLVQRTESIGALTPYHPCPKPLPLWLDLLVSYTEEGARIVDPFVGAGTTLVACHHTERIGYGMDWSPAYAAVTLQRLADLGLEPHLTTGD
jgi:hypothetical protein